MTNPTPDQQIEFNRLCGELLQIGLSKNPYNDFDNDWYHKGKVFDPYNDANDRNEVLEKLRIFTGYCCDGLWNCYIADFDHDATLYDKVEKSMEQAQIACIWEYLNNE